MARFPYAGDVGYMFKAICGIGKCPYETDRKGDTKSARDAVTAHLLGKHDIKLN